MSDDGTNVVGIKDRRPVVLGVAGVEDAYLTEMRTEAIGQLDEIVDAFKRGEMNGFAIVWTYASGGGGSTCSDEVSHIPIEYIGSLDRLKHRIHKEMDWNENGEDDEG